MTYPSIGEVAAYQPDHDAKPTKAERAEQERIRRREIRYAKARAAGREPGRNGRPITRHDHRAVYLRERARRLKAQASAFNLAGSGSEAHSERVNKNVV